MNLLNVLIPLFGLYMLVKHGRRALLFVAPGRGESRRPFLLNFVTALLALLLLAEAVHIALRSH